MNVENLTPDQKKLLCNLVEADESGKTFETGYVDVLIGDDEVLVPRFDDKPLLLRDFEALCDASFLVIEQKRPTPKYRIKNTAYRAARLLKLEKKEQIEDTVKSVAVEPLGRSGVIINRKDFLDHLDKVFSNGELQELCYILGEDYDNMSGQNKRERLVSLIRNLDRKGRINTLIELCKEKRPNYRWQDFLSS